MQIIRRGLGVVRRLLHIQQIPIDVVLEDKPRGVEPVIKNLAAHDVATHPPAVSVPLVPEPVVAQNLGVEVVGLEGRVVDVHFGPLEEEETVVVYQLVAPVQPEEDGLVYALVVVDELITREGAGEY